MNTIWSNEPPRTVFTIPARLGGSLQSSAGLVGSVQIRFRKHLRLATAGGFYPLRHLESLFCRKRLPVMAANYGEMSGPVCARSFGDEAASEAAAIRIDRECLNGRGKPSAGPFESGPRGLQMKVGFRSTRWARTIADDQGGIKP